MLQIFPDNKEPHFRVSAFKLGSLHPGRLLTNAQEASKRKAMLSEHNGHSLYLKGLPPWTQPFRVLEGNYRKCWDLFCFHQDRPSMAVNDAATGCTSSDKHGHGHKTSQEQGQLEFSGKLPVPSEWRRGLWPSAFVIVTPNNAKEVVWYQYSGPVCGCWTFATCLPRPLGRKAEPWQRGVCRTVKSEDPRGSVLRFHACSVTSSMTLDKSLNYVGSNPS